MSVLSFFFIAMESAQQLYANGFVTIPTAAPQPLLGALFDQALLELPEYLPDAPSYALGGFGALGTPSSFHHPHVRALREVAYAHALPVFRALRSITNPAFKLEHLVDRMLFRAPGVHPTRECFHRDTCPDASKGDFIFGGWLNLDAVAQTFSAVPGSHTPGENHGQGFDVVGKEEQQQYRAAARRITVPPGHLLIFFENIVHEVEGTAAPHAVARLFTAFRLTCCDAPLVRNVEELLQAQAVIPLKSGQVPPMFAKLHWVNRRGVLEAFTLACLKPEHRAMAQVGSGAHKGEWVTIPRVVDMKTRAMPAPHSPPFVAYSACELVQYRPHVF